MSIDKKWQYRRKSFWSVDHMLAPSDVTIVGAGIVGLSLAIRLAERLPFISIKVVDAGIGSAGASTRNAGFACIGSISEICSDVQSMGEAAALALVSDRYEGLRLLRERVPSTVMEYEACGGFEVFEDKPSFDLYRAQMDDVNSLLAPLLGGAPCFEVREHEVFGKTIFNSVEGSLHPAKMIAHLERIAHSIDIQLVYDTTVQRIDKENRELHTDEGVMYSTVTIICSNAWTSRLLPDVDVQPARNQVLVTKPIDDMPIRGTYHMHEGYVYFRNIGDQLLIGGGRHLSPEAETTFDDVPSDDLILAYLEELVATRILPKRAFEIEQTWTGHLGVGSQKTPIVRQLTEGLWVATRMGGMGVAIGSLVGKNTANMVADSWQQPAT